MQENANRFAGSNMNVGTNWNTRQPQFPGFSNTFTPGNNSPYSMQRDMGSGALDTIFNNQSSSGVQIGYTNPPQQTVVTNTGT